jgi:CheY-like chemotaxis protein
MSIRHGNVLIVEHDTDIRETLRFVLEDEGYGVYEAPNGEWALPLLRQSPKRMVVLLDLNSPRTDGRELLAAVAQNDALATRHAYIIMAANEKTLPLAIVTQLTDLQASILTKPFDLEHLLAVIQHTERRLDSAPE